VNFDLCADLKYPIAGLIQIMKQFRFAENIKLTPTMLQGAAAILIGLGAGGSVLLFKQIIVWIEVFFHEITPDKLNIVLSWWPVFIPVLVVCW
jgi:hypothetical protein